MVGVVAGEPLEAVRGEVLAPDGRGLLIQLVQVGYETLHAGMLLPVQAIPVDGIVMIPFAPLRKLVAHEGELLARVRPLVGEQGAYAGVFLPVVAGHLAEQRALAVHDLIVANR